LSPLIFERKPFFNFYLMLFLGSDDLAFLERGEEFLVFAATRGYLYFSLGGSPSSPVS
jgi:hypothetical protein